MNNVTDRRKMQFLEFITPILLTALIGIISLASYVIVNVGQRLIENVNALRVEIVEMKVDVKGVKDHNDQVDQEIAELKTQDQWFLNCLNRKGVLK